MEYNKYISFNVCQVRILVFFWVEHNCNVSTPVLETHLHHPHTEIDEGAKVRLVVLFAYRDGLGPDKAVDEDGADGRQRDSAPNRA
jgi:hypothetical protein